MDLSPPSKDVSVPEEDKKFIYFYYNSLQYMLYELGFPETKDRSGAPVRIQKERVTIAILSNPIEVVGILLEGLVSSWLKINFF